MPMPGREVNVTDAVFLQVLIILGFVARIRDLKV